MSPRPPFSGLLALLSVVAVGLASLASCGPAAKGGTPAPVKGPDIAGELDEPKVMTFLFGNYDPAAKRSVVGAQEPKDVAPKAGAPKPGPGKVQAEEEEPDMLATLVGLYRFPEGSPERALAITAANPRGYDAHGQAPQLGGALFEKGPGGWRALARNQAIAEMGSYGRAPEGKLTKLGPGRYGVEFRPGFSNSGITQEGYSLVAETAGSLGEVLALTSIAEENGGACDEGQGTCYAYTSDVKLEPGRNPDWLDVVVRTSGTRLGDGRTVEEFTDGARFTFDGGVYLEEGTRKK